LDGGVRMKTIERILVVVDHMTDHQPAISKAIYLAKQSSASIELFLVVYSSQLVSHWSFDKKQMKAMKDEYIASKFRWLETYLSDVVAQGLTVKLDVCWHKNFVEAVLEKSESSNADLVVKSTHQHPSFNKIFFTPSDWQLLQQSNAPLLLVKKQTKSHYKTIMAAVNPTKDEGKEAGLDNTILDTSIGLVALCEASIHICHCYQPLGFELWQGMSSVGMEQSVASPSFEEYQQGIKEHHQKLFDELLEDFGFDEYSTHLVEGEVEYELPQLVDKYQTDLLVVGMGNEVKFFGNSVENILDNVHCDILSVKVAKPN